MENFIFGREVWRPVKNFEDYLISQFGNAKTVDRYVRGGWNCDQIKYGKPLKICYDYKGYQEIYLWKNNKRYKRRIHTLVGDAFPEICGKHFKGAEIDHLNTIKDDNRAINLKWVTHKRNMNNPLTKKNIGISKSLLKHHQ
jgi:hypothetical protein